jgi:hypothetical protein
VSEVDAGGRGHVSETYRRGGSGIMGLRRGLGLALRARQPQG